MYDRLANLLKHGVTITTAGDPVESVTSSREVFCRVTSADYKEKAYAEQHGTTADLVIILPDAIDYDDENCVELDGKKYRVTDTKFGDTSNELRLVVTRWRTE